MPRTWEQERFDEALKRAKKRAGSGWDLIGAEFREALVAKEVLAVLGACATIEDTPQGRLATLGLQFEG